MSLGVIVFIVWLVFVLLSPLLFWLWLRHIDKHPSD